MVTVMMMATMAFAQSSKDDDAEGLDLSPGTLQFGGRATANIALLDDGNTDVYLLLSPSFGVFAFNKGQTWIAVDLLVDETGFDVGVRGGLDYFFPGKWLAPYVGLGAGYGTRQLDDAPQDYTDSGVFTAFARGGILLPVSDAVAIDLGTEVDVNVAPDRTWVTIPIGYTGIRAFFR